MTDAPQAEHSVLSASSAPRWTRCYGSVALESTQAKTSSGFADEGTAAHALAAKCLGGDPKELRHLTLAHENVSAAAFIGDDIFVNGVAYTVDSEFAEYVQAYVDYVRGLGGHLLVETKVNYANWLGVPEATAWGTSDAIAVHDGSEIITIDQHGYRETSTRDSEGLELHQGRLIMSDVDLKFGKGVPVSPTRNEQAKLYAGGALNEIDLLTEINPDDIIRIAIHQPRIGDGMPLEWYITVRDLKAWLQTEAAMAAQHALAILKRVQALDPNEGPQALDVIKLEELTPGEKQCRFCCAKGVCPALAQEVVNGVAGDFVDLDTPQLAKAVSAVMPSLKVLDNAALASRMKLTDLAEVWIKDVRAEVEGRLLEGQEVPGFKLVEGKLGNRAWNDATAAEALLKSFRLKVDDMYAMTLISPPTAEKVLKAKPKQWAKAQPLISRAPGKPSVATEDDKRPAIKVAATADDFEAVEDMSELV